MKKLASLILLAATVLGVQAQTARTNTPLGYATNAPAARTNGWDGSGVTPPAPSVPVSATYRPVYADSNGIVVYPENFSSGTFEVTVSAHGQADGYALKNNGALLGVDTKNSTTYGINEYLAGLHKQTALGATNINSLRIKFSEGIFYLTNTIAWSNSSTFALTLQGAGEAVTRLFLNNTNPIGLLDIKSQPYDGTLKTGGTHLGLFDLTFTARNSKSSLVAVTNYSKLDVQRCGFFMWEAFTNTQTGANLSIYANGALQMTNLPTLGLVGLSYYTGGDIQTVIRDCQFFGLADGIAGVSDHLILEGNTFGQIGKTPNSATNLWGRTDPLSLGACFVGYPVLNCRTGNNHLYGVTGGYAFLTGGFGMTDCVIRDDIFEGAVNSVCADADGGITIFGYVSLNSINGPGSAFIDQVNYGFSNAVFSANNTFTYGAGTVAISKLVSTGAGLVNGPLTADTLILKSTSTAPATGTSPKLWFSNNTTAWILYTNGISNKIP